MYTVACRRVLSGESELAGTHNSSDLNLFWESDSPVTVNRDLHLTEYRLVNMWSNFSVANYSLTADVRTAFGLQSRLYGKFGECTVWEQSVSASPLGPGSLCECSS
jgi:hypothetical protein